MSHKNLINRKKLFNSKWTAVTPESKEKHFEVTKVELNINDPQVIDSILLRAVFTNRVYQINYKELSDGLIWKVGWK